MFTRIGGAAYKADLSTTTALCSALGNPHLGFRSVHVAGTNGKGSVSSFLASVLFESGLKTGLFTSPHLRDFRERIRINGEMISESYVIDFVEKNMLLFDKLQPSFFEMSFAMAASYFRDMNVDIAIIETGMGGRLDSTNLITPLVSVITNIGFDHVQFLGNTLAGIAREKAGIIKPGIPVVIGERNIETDNVFITHAQNLKSPVFFAEDDYELNNLRYKPDTNMLTVDVIHPDKSVLADIHSPLPGNYQAKNLVTVFKTCEILNTLGFRLDENVLRKGIENTICNTGILGRWQILNRNPLAIADTGHNEHGIRQVLIQIGKIRYSRLHFVLGLVADKDMNSVLSQLPANAIYYFCKPDIPRGFDAMKLASIASKFGLKGIVYSSVTEAYQNALNNSLENDFIFVGGSTFVVAEVV